MYCTLFCTMYIYLYTCILLVYKKLYSFVVRFFGHWEFFWTFCDFKISLVRGLGGVVRACIFGYMISLLFVAWIIRAFCGLVGDLVFFRAFWCLPLLVIFWRFLGIRWVKSDVFWYVFTTCILRFCYSCKRFVLQFVVHFAILL